MYICLNYDANPTRNNLNIVYPNGNIADTEDDIRLFFNPGDTGYFLYDVYMIDFTAGPDGKSDWGEKLIKKDFYYSTTATGSNRTLVPITISDINIIENFHVGQYCLFPYLGTEEFLYKIIAIEA